VQSLPVAVDGAKNPELIPDRLAYRHFIRVASIHTSPSPEELERQRGILYPLHLTTTDQQALQSALGTLRERLDDIEQQRESWQADSATARAVMVSLKSQEREALDGAMMMAKNSLTADGVARLESYVTKDLKRHIVIYGVLPVEQDPNGQ
jgi:hypothetical protein